MRIGQRSQVEVRGDRPEGDRQSKATGQVRGQRSEVRGQRSEVRGERSRGQRSEVRGQRNSLAPCCASADALSQRHLHRVQHTLTLDN